MRILYVALIFLGLAPIAMAADAPPPPLGIAVGDMDRKVEACTNFFDYANGSWRAENPIPASMSRWSRRWASGEASKDQLRELLDKTSTAIEPAKGSVEQLTGDFYAACMDEKHIDELGMAPLKPQLAEIDRIRNRADVASAIARFHAMGIPVPFGLYGQSDNHDPTQVIAQIYASGLGLPDREYYLSKEERFVEARGKYAEHVAKMFGLAGFDAAKSKQATDVVLRIETDLATASLDNVTLRDPEATDHKMAFADLQKLTSHFDWALYAKRMNVRLDTVNVNEPKFMGEVDRQLGEVSIADWKTYLRWKLLAFAAPSLSSVFVQEDFAFNQAYLDGSKEMKPRWKRCVESTDSLLGEALGKIYVEKYFPPAAKARMQEMVANIRTAMGETINGLTWMSAPTKAKALQKLATFNPKIGYPDRWTDYSHVPIARQSYWQDVVEGQKFGVADNLATIGKPLDRGRWGMTPPTSNAYYNPLLNEIVFPAGILQPPAFNMNASDAVNYGAIGVVIGHEISHGYDDSGAQFDAEGKLSNWWSDTDLKEFESRTACVVKQFDGYFIEPGIHHNGKLVVGESIGDLAGARIAFRALAIAQRGKAPLPTIDGFTPEQQFFIAWGQWRGDEERPEFARKMAQGDPHPIGKFRVMGPLSNLPEFQKAFSCPAGSPMVRPDADRCDVW